MTMQRCWIFIYIAFATMMVNGSLQDLRVSVTSVQSRFASLQNVNLVLKYSNIGDATMSIYKWYLPEGYPTDPLFEVTLDGQSVEYVGPIVKRPEPTAEDMVTLAPGMEMSSVIELSSVYDMTQSGNYVIQYKMNSDQVLFLNNSVLQRRLMSFNGAHKSVLQSDPIVVFAVGRQNPLIEQGIEARAQPRALTPSYIGCSASQSSAISSAMSSAESINSNAYQHLNTISAGTTRYATWFGTFSSSNWLTVKSHFTKLQSTLSSKTLAFDCTCPLSSAKSSFAYVYKGQPYRIHLCNAFWPAPTTGTNSKSGTIIHELAHFTVVADANDLGYGHDTCKALARSNPAKAITNADNIEYFAENNPRLN